MGWSCSSDGNPSLLSWARTEHPRLVYNSSLPSPTRCSLGEVAQERFDEFHLVIQCLHYLDKNKQTKIVHGPIGKTAS